MRKLLFIVLAIIAAPALLRAQALADKVPNDAIVYIGWHGTSGSIPGYDGSHLKAMVDASQFSQLIHESIPQMIRKLTAGDQDATTIADSAMNLEGALWEYPTAFFFSGFDIQRQTIKVGIICQAGDKAGELADQVNALLKQAPPGIVKCTAQGDLVIISTYAVDGNPNTPLARNKEFQSDMALLNKAPFATLYVDGPGLRNAIDLGVQAAGDKDIANMWPQVRDGLGLDGLNSVAWTSGFDGKNWLDQAFVDAPAPRHGLMRMGEATIAPDFLKLIPRPSVMAGAGTLDLSGLVPGIIKLAGMIQPDAGATIQQDYNNLTQLLGVDVQKDFLSLLGKDWDFYLDPEAAGNNIMGTVMINRPTDPAKLADSITKIQTFISGMAQQPLSQFKMTVEFRQFDVAGTTVHYLASPLISPTWAIKDGTLYLGAAPQMVAGELQRPADGKSILDNPDYATVAQHLAAPDKIGSFSFVDLPKTIPLSYADWVMASRLYLGAGDLFGLHSPPMVVPPLQTVMAETEATGSVGWADDAGFHLKSVASYPGSEILGSGASMSSSQIYEMSMMMSVLLPSLNRARATANDVKSASNLRQIGLACMMYSNDTRGKMPPDLGTLLTKEDISISAFVKPDNSGSLPANVANMSPDDLAKWVNENSDYAYLGAGKTMDQIGPEGIVAYDKQATNGIVNILFGDFHVEALPQNAAEPMIAKGKR